MTPPHKETSQTKKNPPFPSFPATPPSPRFPERRGTGHRPPLAMEPVLDLDNLTAVRVLGRGAMGTVFLVTNRSSHPPSPPFALKVFDKTSPRPDADRRARWEVSVLRQLRGHPLFPTLLGTAETPEILAWALPFCPGGDLNALRHSLPDRVLSPTALRFYLAELVTAIAHLHSLGIVYRDLKPENILLQSSGHLLLADFDLSRRLSPAPLPPSPPPLLLPSPRHRRNLTRVLFTTAAAATHQLKKAKSARVSPVSRRQTSGSGSVGGERSHSFVGTEEYVSPEVVRGEGHEFAVDWWALGILSYELAYGRTPFRGRNRKETFRNVLTKQPEFVGRHRSELTDLIARLLAKDPVRRLGHAGGAAEVRAHPFFSGVRWDLLGEVARPPFLATVEEMEEAAAEGVQGKEGFDVRDYIKRLRQQQAAPPATASTSVSLTEF